jgi:O-methyltransferase
MFASTLINADSLGRVYLVSMALEISMKRLLRPLLVRQRKNSSKFHFAQDGVQTKNLASFRSESSFQLLKNELIEHVGLDYGMDWRTHIYVELAAYAKNHQGDFVELGCGEGWMMNAILLGVPDLHQNRRIFAFDKFNGMQVDMVSGEDGSEIHPRYPSGKEWFISRLVNPGVVEVYQAHLPDGLEVLQGREISFLHIDLNAVYPEVRCLEMLFDQVVSGGVIVLDDFGGRGRSLQNSAIRSLSKKLKFRILELPTGQGIIFKQTEVV